MIIKTKEKEHEGMSLYTYVMSSFEQYFDLTEGRKMALNFYLNNVKARYVDLELFKAVFNVEDSLEDILRVLTDSDKFGMLQAFGEKCLEEYEHSISVRTPYGVRLRKAK